jgi:hypothetical protein
MASYRLRTGYIVIGIGIMLSSCICQITTYASPTLPPCESNVWVAQEGGQLICQPKNIQETNVVTLYETFRFGQGQDYLTARDAALAAKEKLGDRPIKLYCGAGRYEGDSTIEEFLGDQKLQEYCPEGGYIEVWFIQ